MTSPTPSVDEETEGGGGGRGDGGEGGGLGGGGLQLFKLMQESGGGLGGGGGGGGGGGEGGGFGGLGGNEVTTPCTLLPGVVLPKMRTGHAQRPGWSTLLMYASGLASDGSLYGRSSSAPHTLLPGSSKATSAPLVYPTRAQLPPRPESSLPSLALPASHWMLPRPGVPGSYHGSSGT